jgi:hypothetical protein
MMVSMAEEVACTLTAADLAVQGNGWARLAFRAAAGDGVEDELQRLVAVERECCAWASWTVRADGADVVLEVRSAAPEGIAVLHGMFAGSL